MHWHPIHVIGYATVHNVHVIVTHRVHAAKLGVTSAGGTQAGPCPYLYLYSFPNALFDIGKQCEQTHFGLSNDVFFVFLV